MRRIKEEKEEYHKEHQRRGAEIIEYEAANHEWMKPYTSLDGGRKVKI